MPSLTGNNQTGTSFGQSLPVSSFFNATTPNGAITKYQILDTTTAPNSGYFIVNGVAKAAGTAFEITAAQLANTAFIVGHVDDSVQIRAFDGTAWSSLDSGLWTPVTVIAPINHMPVLTTSTKTGTVGSSLALSSLFNVTDSDGDTITKYQLWDGTRDAGSGHFVIGSAAQASGTVIEITAAQLASTSFVIGTTADVLQIRAFDGQSWSAGDDAPWAPFIVSPPVNHAPVLTTTNRTSGVGSSLTLASLINVTDADGDTMTRYQLWDGTADPNSGHFVINGVAQAARTIIDVTAADLANTSFVVGTAADGLQIRAYDGRDWSASETGIWAPFIVAPPVNHAPVLTTTSQTAAVGATLALSNLITISDADGDSMTKFQLWDGGRDAGSGHFVIGTTAQPAGTVIEITAAQLASTSFVVGTTPDALQIRAFDGRAWSAGDIDPWAPFLISPPVNHAPVVTPTSQTAAVGSSLPLSSMINVTDADGDTITKYQLWDGNRDPNSGYFTINGLKQAAGTVLEITAAQLSGTAFVIGNSTDGLQVRAFDGRDWSATDNAPWSPFTVSPPLNHAPTVTTSDRSSVIGATFGLSSLFTVSDPDGDTITKYQLWDSVTDPNSGYFTVSGVKQAAGTTIEVSAAQLTQVNFVVGSITDELNIRAFDGRDWSAGDNAAWSPFFITPNVPVIIPRQISPPPFLDYPWSGHAGQALALGNLFNVSTPNGPIIKYQLWDGSVSPASGHFVVNGVDQPARTVIEITAAQLTQTSFVVGLIQDQVEIRAFDGTNWSAPDNSVWGLLTHSYPADTERQASVAPFVINVAYPSLPVVITHNRNAPQGATLELSSLIDTTRTDPNTAITKYQLWDSNRDSASGHFVVNGEVQAAGTIIDITAAQLSQTSFVTGTVGDGLQIRAFNGYSWSAGDDSVWAPFTISVRATNAAPVLTTGDLVTTPHAILGLAGMILSVTDADGDA